MLAMVSRKPLTTFGIAVVVLVVAAGGISFAAIPRAGGTFPAPRQR
jgi:hypothetical protein